MTCKCDKYVKTLKKQQRFIIETKANAESVIATEKANNEQ